MASKRIKGQGIHIIHKAFKEGVDKYSYKKEHGHQMADKVFSYSEKRNLTDTWKNFSNFVREYDPQIHYIKDLDKDHVQAFLDHKAETCTANTLKTYKQNLLKIEKIANSYYSTCNLDVVKETNIPTECKQGSNKGVNNVISREDYNKILDYCSKSNEQSCYAIRLQEHIANRVAGTVSVRYSQYNANEGTISIKGKGNKWHTVKLDDAGKKLIEEIHSKNFNQKDADRLFSIRPDTVNAELSRIQGKLGIDRHSFHDVRRLKAQENYNYCRKELGMNRQEAINHTSKFLSHGENRNYMMCKSYIKAW